MASGAGGETVRAFAIFSLMFLALAAISVQLLRRDLSLRALESRLSLGRDEATRVAAMVAALGRDEGGINFHLLQQKQDVLIRLIVSALAADPTCAVSRWWIASAPSCSS